MELNTSSASIRLKHFLDYTGLSNSQFADACAIPRPTLSQLLSGRNKKLSDQLLRPIHERFPQLSLLWLMFGEGEMLIQSSGAVNGVAASTFGADEKINENQAVSSADAEPDVIRMPNNSEMASCREACDNGTADTLVGKNHGIGDDAGHHVFRLSPKAIRKVRNIVVYYDDNTYETFFPDVADS